MRGGIFYRSATGLDEWGQLSLSGILFDSLGIQAGWVGLNPYINNPTWYISVLLLCYLIFYCINKVCALRHCDIVYSYIGMVLVGVAVMSYGIELPFLNSYSARGYYAFFTGTLLRNHVDNNGRLWNMRARVLIAIACISLTVLAIMYYRDSLAAPFDDYYWLTFAFFPALVILADTNFAKRLFTWEGWSLLAKSSFNMYIWHVCFEILWKYLLFTNPVLQGQTEWKMMLAALSIDEVIGLVSYFLLEKPIAKRADEYLATLA